MPQRWEWMDAGRGLAIVLVVLMHASDWLETAGLPMTGWEQLHDVLSGVRMPLFFTISGMLGARWVGARWSALASKKVTYLFWVYLVWQPIGLAAAAAADQITGDHKSYLHWVVALAATVVRPRSELWFLWALSVYFVLARLTCRVRLSLQLVAAGAVAAVALCTQVSLGTLGWNGPPKFYVFFLLGAHCRTQLLSFAQRMRGSVVASLALIMVWVGAAAASQVLDADRFVGPGLLTRSLGLLAGIAMAGLLARGRLLRYLGARTLPIYLAHTPLLVLMVCVLHAQPAGAWIHMLTPVLPLLLTLAAVPLTLLLHRMLLGTPARVLYAPPAGATNLVHRLCSTRQHVTEAGATGLAATPLPWLPADSPPWLPVGPAETSPARQAGPAAPVTEDRVELAPHLDLPWPAGHRHVDDPTWAVDLVDLTSSVDVAVSAGVCHTAVAALERRSNSWPTAGPATAHARPLPSGARHSPYPTGVPLRPPYSLSWDPAAANHLPERVDPRAAPRRPRHRAGD
ncbi:MAG TPA: acyltransferase [Kineosporiaceae bacterium]